MNHEFAEWLVEKTHKYVDDRSVVEKYFSPVLAGYIAGRLVGSYPDAGELPPDSEEQKTFTDALSIIGEASGPEASAEFWRATQRLLEAGSLDLYDIGSRLIDTHVEALTPDRADTLIGPLFDGIGALYSQVPQELEIWLTSRFQTLEQIVLAAEDELGDQSEDVLEYGVVELAVAELSASATRAFLERLLVAPGAAAQHVRAGIWRIFDRLSANADQASPYLELLVEQADVLEDEIADDVLNTIRNLAAVDTVDAVSLARQYLEKVLGIERFRTLALQDTASWVELLRPVEGTVLGARLDLLLLLHEYGSPTAGALSESILILLPSVEGDQQSIDAAIRALSQISDELSQAEGLELYSTLRPLVPKLGASTPIGLRMMSRWNPEAEPDVQREFSSAFNANFPTWPVELALFAPSVIPNMEPHEIEGILVSLYSVQQDAGNEIDRRSLTRLGLSTLNDEQRASVVETIWKRLAEIGAGARDFMADARSSLGPEDLVSMRRDAIARIREVSVFGEAESSFQLLESTASSSVREIMPTVDMFVELFSGDEESVRAAAQHAYACLRPLDLRSDHKHKLAPAMAGASARLGGELEKSIRYDAGRLGLTGLRGWAYRKYWDGDGGE